ncbi:hypothetical protein [Endozoicomonas sp. 4G]|uniref:hypothetical protein n=1 Tax=Endozoicomonas sp. 4G TaxID=2872754 RepID=UPI002078BC87|nr:hypothetical protein [Endozoicomonas sp. 4G]
MSLFPRLVRIQVITGKVQIHMSRENDSCACHCDIIVGHFIVNTTFISVYGTCKCKTTSLYCSPISSRYFTGIANVDSVSEDT